jgi:hypothetical protein
MTEAITLLALLAAFLAYLAWNYRCDYCVVTDEYNRLLGDYQEATRRHREERTMLTQSERAAWSSYTRALRIAIENDKARIAAEQRAEQLTRNEGAADAEPDNTPERGLAAVGDCSADNCSGVGRCSKR